MSNSSGLLGEALDAALQLEAEERDVSISPDEVFGVTGATSQFLGSRSGPADTQKRVARPDTPQQKETGARTGLSPGVSPDSDESLLRKAAREGPQPTRFEETVAVDRDDYRRARERHEERSAAAQRVDERRDAEVTANVDEWAARPDELDFPGVDSVDSVGPRF
jgi:hypothetical protein